jgi:hypothetical protein
MKFYERVRTALAAIRRLFALNGGLAMRSGYGRVSGLASGMPNSHIHTRTCMMISLTTILASEAVRILE